MNAPCHGCPNRRENCHSMCLQYKHYQVVVDAERGTRAARGVGQITMVEYGRRWRNTSERQRRKRAEGWFAE